MLLFLSYHQFNHTYSLFSPYLFTVQKFVKSRICPLFLMMVWVHKKEKLTNKSNFF